MDVAAAAGSVRWSVLAVGLVGLSVVHDEAPPRVRAMAADALAPMAIAAARAAGTSASPSGRSPLGVNVAPFAEWSPEWALVDVFPRSGPWLDARSEPASPEHIAATDSAGWPLRTRTRLLTRLGYAGNTPPGEYVITWQGHGELIGVAGAGRGLRCEDGQPLAGCALGRGRFRVEFSRDDPELFLSLEPMTPDRRVHSIRVLMPGGVCGRSAAALDPTSFCQTARGGQGSCPPGERCFDFADVGFDRFGDPPRALGARITFHPWFLRDLRPYRALRFMDWQRTNDSPLRHFRDRVTLRSRRYAGERGAPLELAVALANAVRADAWFNVPHLADDAFVRDLARLVRATLQPDLAVYVEYSNETWNTDFVQSAHVVARGRASAACARPATPLEAWEPGRCFHALESARVARVFRTEFGRGRERVRGVLATWAADAGSTRFMLERLEQARSLDLIDAIAIAPYFGAYLGDERRRGTVAALGDDGLFEELEGGAHLQTEWQRRGGALAATRDAIHRHARLADAFGLSLVAYEGGQHLAARGEAKEHPGVTALFNRANRDPRMHDLYLEYLRAWKALGGGLFVHYYTVGLYDRHGSWGAKPSTDTPLDHAPKARALAEFARTTPCWWSGC